MSTALKTKIETAENETGSELPEGWATALLGDLAKVEWGNTSITKKSYTEKGFPAFSASGKDGFLPSAEWHGQAVVLSAIGARCGKCFCAEGDWTAIKNTIVIQAEEKSISNRYLFFYLNDDRRWSISGSGQPFITMGTAQVVPVPVAPREEQNRIVKQIENLILRTNVSRTHLAKCSVIVKAFRQAVLAAACSGKLTEDWRKNDGDDRDLPAGWRWSPLKDVLPKGCIFDGPFGSNLKTSDYVNSGIRVVRLENIGRLKFIHSKQVFVSEEKYNSLKKHTVYEGDIVFASFIEDEIRTCVLPKLATKAIAKADCFCLRPDSKSINSHYLALQLSSAESYDALVEQIHGATRPRVNTTQLKRLLVRICPLPEQQEIVRRVDALFKLADAIEKRVAAASIRAERLTQAILAKAFRGELVPTEAELARREGREYEPASVLLEKIRKEREKTNFEKTKSTVHAKRGKK